MSFSKRLRAGATRAAAVTATAIALGMAVISPASAALPRVTVTIQVRIDEVGWVMTNGNHPQESGILPYSCTRFPYDTWQDMKFTVPVGTTIWVNEGNCFYDFGDGGSITVTADQSVYEVDLVG